MGMMDLMMNGMMTSMTPEDKQDTMLKLMPEMLKRIKSSEVLALIGDQISNMMFVTHQSKFDFSETIQKIKERGEAFGWYHPMVNNHYEMEMNLGLENPNRVATISMCIPRSAYKILKVNKKLAVMMPLQINVYEEDGRVFITWMNIKMMGKLFGETVSEIMGKAVEDMMVVHKGIIEEKGE
jgi:uncharacterized protein (DUF302 family)